MFSSNYTSSCGKSPLKSEDPNGIGINKNMVIKKRHPDTTPKASGLKYYWLYKNKSFT